MINFEPDYTEGGKIIDFVSGNELVATPEEAVRQGYLKTLHYDYKYPKNVIGVEIPVFHGGKEILDSDGNPVRADIVIYKNRKAKAERDQGKILIIVECKRPEVKSGYKQLVSYIFNTSAEGGVWYNGKSIKYYRRETIPNLALNPWVGIPRYREAWDSIGRQKKEDLIKPKDIKGILRRCHNKLHGRGVDSDEEDLTLDMVRIILAKAMDEELPGEFPLFYCTAEEYSTEEGQNAAATRVQELFENVKTNNTDVFQSHETISVGPGSICDVVIELQQFKLISDLNESDDWDIMGAAYEQYTSTYLKRVHGQFFTNRLIIDLMVEMVDPAYTDTIFDPAGGSGGFLTGALRYVRTKILSSNSTLTAKNRQLDRHRTNLFMVEISKRLVKIAKTAMILNGDGHTGMTQGDSLDSIEKWNENVRAKIYPGSVDVILANPPFAGVGEGRVTRKEILRGYQTANKWTNSGGEFQFVEDILFDGVPPEMLFFERSVNLLAAGGKMAIVMPKSFLDTKTYYVARRKLFSECKLLAVINCHKNTFQPHTGVRTCIIILEKREEIEEEPVIDNQIFMAINKKIGQDSEGRPIYKRNKKNELTEEIDHDLSIILEDFNNFKNGNLEESEYRFIVKPEELIVDDLNINPQKYLPNLHATIKKIESIDGTEGWSVSTIGQSFEGIKVFKGPRLKTENIVVEAKINDSVEPYYTPSAVLQEKGESVKLFNLDIANEKQLKDFDTVRVNRGDILITRSGTVGRVAMITNRLDNAIVSDDMIRVIIPDEFKRFYVYAYLQSKDAYDQMIRNEYGAVQQHLEPQHIKDIIIPIPDSWDEVENIVNITKAYFNYKELAEDESFQVDHEIKFLIDRISN